VTDQEYDKLEEQYESKYGKIGKIGAKPPEESKKVKLLYPMCSLDKMKDEKTLTNWINKNISQHYCVTEKLDGVSVYIQYSKNGGRMHKRGDENEGTDISDLLQYIQHPNYKDDLAVRGELVIETKTFQDNFPNYKTARNFVSGVTNMKISDPEKLKYIKFVGYQIFSDQPAYQKDQLETLQKLNFEVPKYTLLPKDNLSIDFLTDLLLSFRNKSVYDMDGIVVCSEQLVDFPKDSNPKHVMAFKLPGESFETEVLDIEWNVSKNGLIKPTVLFQTVTIGGVNVSRATGHNARFILENGIGPEAKILIIRSGETIPKIVAVSQKGKECLPEMDYKWDETSVEFVATSNDAQNEMNVKRIESFFSELDIKNLGYATVSKIYKSGKTTLKDFLNLKANDISNIPGLGQTIAAKIINNIQNCPKQPLHSLMAASCLFENFGSKRLKIICDNIPDLHLVKEESRLPALESKILTLSGFRTLADKFVSRLLAFNTFFYENGLNLLLQNSKKEGEGGEETKSSPPREVENKKGEVILFSGVRPDKEVENELEKRGHRTVSGVSGKVTLLVIQDAGGQKTSKIQYALEKKIPILVYSDFVKKFLC
jgi:NAD-dependent DNA ligase